MRVMFPRKTTVCELNESKRPMFPSLFNKTKTKAYDDRPIESKFKKDKRPKMKEQQTKTEPSKAIEISTPEHFIQINRTNSISRGIIDEKPRRMSYNGCNEISKSEKEELDEILSTLDYFTVSALQGLDQMKSNYISTCESNFDSLFQTLEKNRTTIFGEITNFFNRLKTGFDFWKEKFVSRLKWLQTIRLSFESPEMFEVEIDKLRKEVNLVTNELNLTEHLSFSYNFELFELVKSFCQINFKSSDFLTKFMFVEEDNLFLESIHDPFKEILTKDKNFKNPQNGYPHLKSLVAKMSMLQLPRESLSNQKVYSSRNLEKSQKDWFNKKNTINSKNFKLFQTYIKVQKHDKPFEVEHDPRLLLEDFNPVNLYKNKTRVYHSTNNLFGSTLSNRKQSIKFIENEEYAKKSLKNGPYRSRIYSDGEPTRAALTSLDLAHKNMTNEELMRFFEGLTINGGIKTIDLSRNKITDNCLKGIFENIRSIEVERIVLKDNCLTENALDLIINFKKENIFVRTFDLVRNESIFKENKAVMGKLEKLKKQGVVVEI